MKYLYILIFVLINLFILHAQNDCQNKYPLLTSAYKLINENYHSSSEKSELIKSSYKKMCVETHENNLSEIQLVDKFIKSIHDYSLRVISIKDFNNFINEVTGAEHNGIGIPELLSVDIDEKTKMLTVISPLPNSPASKAGLLAGDKIIKINGVATAGLTLSESMNMLRKSEGEIINIIIERENHAEEKNIITEKLPAVNNPVSVKDYVLNGKTFSYLWIKRFDSGSAENVKKILLSLNNNSAGLIMDLRNNPGGLVTEALEISSYFLGNQKIISVLKGKDTLNTFNSDGDKIYAGDIVVLINKGTASAAELLASALRYHLSAKIIGEKSFGKGLLHNFFPLDENNYLSIPIGKLFTLDNVDILLSGITPDELLLSNIFNEFDEHLEKDNLLRRAAEIISKN